MHHTSQHYSWNQWLKNDKNNLIIRHLTFTKELGGILRIPRAGSMTSGFLKATSRWNQAHVTWTHNISTSVGFRAPPANHFSIYSKSKLALHHINDQEDKIQGAKNEDYAIGKFIMSRLLYKFNYPHQASKWFSLTGVQDPPFATFMKNLSQYTKVRTKRVQTGPKY